MEALEVLSGFFLYDLKVFSDPWMYIPLLIPATAYLCFFIVKWTVLSLPFWLPLSIIFTPLGMYEKKPNQSARLFRLKKGTKMSKE